MIALSSPSSAEKRVSPTVDEFQTQEKEALIKRHRNTFSDFQATGVNDESWPKLLRLNFYISSRDIWPTQDLASRAEGLQNDIFEYISSQEGYSDFVKKEILALQGLKEAQKAPTYETDIIRAFRLVEFLPTPEVVIMLGSLLEYDEGYFVDGHLTKAIERKSIAARAMETINRYPLIEPELKIDPSNIKLAYPDVLVPQWQAWWQEIVDGERVFQLEGDPTRYNHLGPVSVDWKPKSASRATATPSAQTPSRTSPPRTTPSPEIKAQENRFLWASLALVVIALLAWAKTRFQKKRTGAS